MAHDGAVEGEVARGVDQAQVGRDLGTQGQLDDVAGHELGRVDLEGGAVAEDEDVRGDERADRGHRARRGEVLVGIEDGGEEHDGEEDDGKR